jgi:hypothetical protein
MLSSTGNVNQTDRRYDTLLSRTFGRLDLRFLC